MADIKLHGDTVETIGSLPASGTAAPAFTLVKSDLSEVSLNDYKGKNLIINIFVSLDTSTCAASVRKFNKEASNLQNTAVLCVSADLPFASGRFCSAEGIENVSTASVFRSPEFGKDYGVTMVSGPLKGFLSRAVVVVGSDGKIKYTQQVPEVSEEPDYDSVLKSLS